MLVCREGGDGGEILSFRKAATTAFDPEAVLPQKILSQVLLTLLLVPLLLGSLM